MHQHVYIPSCAHAHPGEHLSECNERPPSAVRLYLCLQSRAGQGGACGLVSLGSGRKNNLPHRVLAACSGAGRGLDRSAREEKITPFIASSIMGLGVARGGITAGQPRSARGGEITPFIASLIMGLGVGVRWGGGTASCSLAGMRGVGVKWSALAWRGG